MCVCVCMCVCTCECVCVCDEYNTLDVSKRGNVTVCVNCSRGVFIREGLFSVCAR